MPSYRDDPRTAPPRRRRRRRRRRSLAWLWVLLVLLALLGGGVFALSRFYVFAGGSLYPRDSQTLDLRNEAVSVEQFEALRRQLPDSEILWSVPVGGGRFDSRSEHIAISSYGQEDDRALARLSALKSVDATAAALTAAQYESLCAAVPGAEVRWSVPFGDGRFASDAEEIRPGSFALSDLDMLRYFTALRRVDARGSDSYEAILALRDALPGAEVLWQVPLGGDTFAQDTEELVVRDTSVTAEELGRALGYLPAVTAVTAEENSWSEAEKESLTAAYPSVRFLWPVTVRGVRYTTDIEELSYAGESLSEADMAELAEKLSHFPALKRLDLTDCGVTDEQVFALCDAIPAVDVVWTFDLLGKRVSTMDTLLDLSGITMDSTEPVERILPYMHHLEKVDMSDCGFSDEEMDALNKKYENVRFVWLIRIVYYKIRTDDVAFRATSSHYSTLDDKSIRRLQYCEDMVALDLGHRMVTTLEFVRNMPKLKYLVLMQCNAMDLSPLADCKELIWLELNHSLATDISPLKECTGLRDLNITDLPVDAAVACETLSAMPWLERLWYTPRQFTDAQVKAIQDANPSLYMHAVPSWANSCQDPWRYDQDYYDMRDVMNMFYMDESGRINFKIIDGVRYELDPEFIANQGDTSHDKDRG